MSKELDIWVENRVCMMAQDGPVFDELGQDGMAYKLVHCMPVCIQDMQQA